MASSDRVPGPGPSGLRNLIWLGVFGVGFGFVEAAVVVYLRALYYPDGFSFPLALPEARILTVELVREFATLLMLLGAAMLVPGTGWVRFGAFCYAFGVWDVVYYLGLWAVLDWPGSLLTWDVLFLLPGVWTGPVLSAVLIAGSLIAAGSLMMTRFADRAPRTAWWVWGLAGASLALLLGAFLANHGRVRTDGMPGAFPWWLHGPGLLLGWVAFAAAYRGVPGTGERPARRPRRQRSLVETRF